MNRLPAPKKQTQTKPISESSPDRYSRDKQGIQNDEGLYLRLRAVTLQFRSFAPSATPSTHSTTLRADFFRSGLRLIQGKLSSLGAGFCCSNSPHQWSIPTLTQFVFRTFGLGAYLRHSPCFSLFSL